MNENLFKLANEKVVKTLCHSDNAIWIPNGAQITSNHLQLLSLVVREASTFKPWQKKYYPPGFTLANVVRGERLDKVASTDDIDAGTHVKTSFFKMKGSMNAKFANVFDMTFSSVAGVTLKSLLGELYKKEVTIQSLIKRLQNKKINMNHHLLEQMQAKKRTALCVVTGIVRAKCQPNKPVLTANVSFKADADIKAQVLGQGGSLSGGVESHTLRSYEVPAESILAYKVAELKIDIITGDTRIMVCKGGTGGFGVVSDCFGPKLAIQSMLREMVHSQGGFTGNDGNAGMAADDLTDDFETQCSSVVEPKPVDMKQGLADAFANVSSDEKKRFVALLLQLCADSESLLQLLDLLGDLDKARSENEDIKDILCIVGQCKNSKYIHMLCESLANLDGEALYSLSSMEVSQLALLQEVVASAFEGHALPLHDCKLQQLMTMPQAMDVLLAGLDYHIDADGLTPPNNYLFLESAHIALKIIKSILE